jgi:hypothetical protein
MPSGFRGGRSDAFSKKTRIANLTEVGFVEGR